MLGKTNITTIEGGTIVSDIEDYSWDAIMIEGITSDFEKVIYDNNTLVAITKDGSIAHSRDGEIWEVARLDLEEQYELNDVIWDGRRYVIVGSCMRSFPDGWLNNVGEFYVGLVAVTDDFKEFNITFDQAKRFSRYMSIAYKNGGYILAIAYFYFSMSLCTEISIYAGQLDTLVEECILVYETYKSSENVLKIAKDFLKEISFSTAKNSVELLFYLKQYSRAESGHFHLIATTIDGKNYTNISSRRNVYSTNEFSIFECKDNLYYCAYNAEWLYEFAKIIGTHEKVIISTNINFSFLDAVYFNKCEILINAHQMLIVKPGEKLTDKTLDDLIEITYDFSMSHIVKAFNELYIFGTGGNILVSSNEVKNEEALAVKTMSASKALYDANAYTDKKYAELEARIEMLENKS